MDGELGITLFDKAGRAQGLVCLGAQIVVYTGRPPDILRTHRKPAATVIVALDQPMVPRYGKAGPPTRCVLCPADITLPPVSFGDGRVVMVAMAPNAPLWLALKRYITMPELPLLDASPISEHISERFARVVETAISPSRLLADAEALLQPEGEGAVIMDSRVSAVIQRLHDNPSASEVRIESLASELQLSVPRLVHLFREHAGVSFRRYRMWARMLKAARSLAYTSSLTEVAVAAGFTDSAHLSRSFREMFGLNPSQVFRYWRAMEDPGVAAVI